MAESYTRGWPYTDSERVRRAQAKVALGRRQEALARAPLFSHLSKRQLRSLAGLCVVSSYPRGATVIEEGSTGSGFFVVLEGEGRVIQGGRTVARLSPGDFFGEISLLDPGPRTATITATKPMVCLDLAGKDFMDVLAADSRLAATILRELGKRLRQMGRQPNA